MIVYWSRDTGPVIGWRGVPKGGSLQRQTWKQLPLYAPPLVHLHQAPSVSEVSWSMTNDALITAALVTRTRSWFDRSNQTHSLHPLFFPTRLSPVGMRDHCALLPQTKRRGQNTAPAAGSRCTRQYGLIALVPWVAFGKPKSLVSITVLG